MAKQIQFRRGTTAEHSTFTGVEGEVTVDTDKDTLVVHDGSTAGGFPLVIPSDLGPLVGFKATTTTSLTSTTGTSYVDVTNMTLDYTQAAAGNFVLITAIGTIQGSSTNSTTQVRPWATIAKDGTQLAPQSFNLIGETGAGNLLHTFSGSLSAYVSAGDTSSHTYNVRIKCQNASAALSVTWGSGISGNSTSVLSIMEFEV